MPSISLVNPKYRHLSSTGFASSCEDIFSESFVYWCFGHTHTRDINVISGINFICNPRGYPSESKDFDDMVFEIM